MCVAIFVIDVELSVVPVVSVARADDTALEAAASSEEVDELTAEQMLPEMLVIAVGI